jgi:hypothetical protein
VTYLPGKFDVVFGLCNNCFSKFKLGCSFFLPAQFAHILGYVKPWAEICTTTFRGAHYEAKPSTFKLSGDKNIPK